MGLRGGRPGPVVELQGEGFTYLSSEGFGRYPDGDFGEWRQFFYPNHRSAGGDVGLWYRGEPTVEGLEALLRCKIWQDNSYSQCSLWKVNPPVYYEIKFNWKELPSLYAIEAASSSLIECINLED
jgi:hypothetical protein